MPTDTPTAPCVRPMPGYDPDWFRRFETANARRLELLSKPGALTEAERDSLAAAQREMDAAHRAQFPTVAAYRDQRYAWAEELLANEGIDMVLPSLGDDCTCEDVDQVMLMVADAVEVTNGENF